MQDLQDSKIGKKSSIFEAFGEGNAFSVAGNLVTKYRNRLSDQAIDDLTFEKGYFLKEGHSI